MKVVHLILSLCMVLHFVQGIETHSNASATDGIVKTITYCFRQPEKMDCLKRNIINKFKQEVIKNETIEIGDMISIKRDVNWIDENSIDEKSIETIDGVKGRELDKMLVQEISDYFKSIVVQFKLNGDAEEGRRRKGGKGGGVLMYGALGIATVLTQLFMGKLALISGTALLVAKIALMLAFIAGLKKMSHGGGSEHVVYAAGGDHGGWQRSGFAHDMAYKGYGFRGKNLDIVPSQIDYSGYNNAMEA